MSTSGSPAHESVAVSPGLSDTEPPDEWKRHIEERINTNLKKLFQVTEELYRRRLQKVRSNEYRVHIKEVHKLEIDQIHTLAAEEYDTQLELERQRRKRALGQPIDAKWQDVLMREHRIESHELPGPKWAQSSRFNEPAAESIRDERYGQSSPVKYEIWRPNINTEEAAGTRRGLARRGSVGEARQMSEETKNQEEETSRKQEEAMRLEEESKRKEEARKEEEDRRMEEEVQRKVEDATGSVSREYQDPDGSPPSPAPDLSDTEPPDERIMDSTHTSERPIRSERYGPSSPVKHENWRPNINAEEDAAGPRRGSESTASQHSVGSNSIRSLTTESILKRPDGSERDNIPRKNDGESVALSPDKGKERQHQSRTLQLVTEPNGRREELPVPGSPSPPLSESSHETLRLLLVTLTEVRFLVILMRHKQQLLLAMGCPRSTG
jgi:hypothetical protein